MFNKVLESAGNAIRELAGEPAECDAPRYKGGVESVTAHQLSLFNTLSENLINCDIHGAEKCLESITRDLEGAPCFNEIAPIEESVGDFDFEKALTDLDRLAKMLGLQTSHPI